jgi:hypothetical protein
MRQLSSFDLQIIVVIYVLGFLVTLGFLLRSGSRRAARQLLRVFVAAFWPVYWIVVHGVANTVGMAMNAVATILDAFGKVLVTIGDIIDRLVARLFDWIWLAYVIVMLLFPAYYIAKNWGLCSGTECVGVIARALIWAPFWPVYWFTA